MLRCCLIQIAIIKFRHILYLVYLCPCLDLSLFISRLCDPFFIFSLIFIAINQRNSFKQAYLFFAYFLEYLLLCLDYNENGESEQFSNGKGLALGCCLAFAWFFPNFSVTLLIKMLFIKKACSFSIEDQRIRIAIAYVSFLLLSNRYIENSGRRSICY